MSSVVDPAVSSPVTPAPVPPAPPVPTAPAIVINEKVRLPAGLVDLEAFRAWARENRPEGARVSWLAGEIWIEMSMEQFYSHNQVKTEVTSVLRLLSKSLGRGRFLSDGMLLTHAAAELSTIPDGIYVTYATLDAGRVREVPGRSGGAVELQGTPDMVVEILSDSSVEKDMGRLPEQYRRAGIAEFWRVDARQELRFEVFRLTDTGYAPAQEPDGWWRSAVFERSFHLTQFADPRGQPDYTLEVRE
jgi:Uma2 family endonuclease